MRTGLGSDDADDGDKKGAWQEDDGHGIDLACQVKDVN